MPTLNGGGILYFLKPFCFVHNPLVDSARVLQFECFDWDKNSAPDEIGSFRASLNDLQTKREWPFVNPKKLKKKGYAHSGQLIVDGIEFKKEHGFLDYIFGGCQISLMVAIDFTASNGYLFSFVEG